MTQSQPSPLRVISCFILITACIISTLVLVIILSIPNRAEQEFGPADPNLNYMDRIYLSVQLLLAQDQLHTPVDPLGVPQEFDITLGEPVGSISARLQDNHLISDGGAFQVYLLYRGLDTSIQAGSYTLSPAMNAIEIASQLQDATPTHVNFVILPGWRLEQIAEALPTSGLDFSPAEFLQAAGYATWDYPISQEIPPGNSLEGFFFPGIYELHREISVNQFIRQILVNFDANVTPDLLQGFNRQGLNVYQAVTLASIVEREAVNDAEMPLISSVFHNRLQAGIKLDADPTIQYAVGFNPDQNSWWTSPLRAEHLAIDSPYNTYLNAGLPPGPIANPSLNALMAVAFPAQTPYYYFRAACDESGNHVFAETFAEHQANACP